MKHIKALGLCIASGVTAFFVIRLAYPDVDALVRAHWYTAGVIFGHFFVARFLS